MAHNPQTEAQLKRWVIYEWNRLDLNLLSNTIDKMVERIPKIIKANGNFVENSLKTHRKNLTQGVYSLFSEIIRCEVIQGKMVFVWLFIVGKNKTSGPAFLL